MKQAKVVLAYSKDKTTGEARIVRAMCPMCGYALIIDATVRIKATREFGQMPLQLDGDPTSAVAAMVEEAERHG